jgi:hypothetical protein
MNDIDEKDIELTQDQILDLKRTIQDHENPVRFVIYSEIVPSKRWRMFLNISDNTWCDDIYTATLFKEEHIARVVSNEYSEGRHKDLSIAKITTRTNIRKVLRYFR